jgi:hypothetical protein
VPDSGSTFPPETRVLLADLGSGPGLNSNYISHFWGRQNQGLMGGCHWAGPAVEAPAIPASSQVLVVLP